MMARDTGRIPKPLQDKPELHGDLPDLWKAFARLSRQRPSGMGLSAIPLRDMREYMDEYGVHDRDEFIDIIGAVDDEWLALQAKRMKLEGKKGG